MTDTELRRLQAICEVASVDDIEDLSDGFHTFNDLYEQRMYLFAALVNAYPDRAWKSLRHEDGEMCFGGDWFIVGIDTPEGSYTYHYNTKYWEVFDCQMLPRAKHWDGHTEKDVTRLLSLPSVQPDVPDTNVGDLISRQEAKVSVARYFEVHIRNQKSRRLKEHAKEICKDICFGIDAWPSAQPSRGLIEQIEWERDLAIQQLNDLGYAFGEDTSGDPKIIRCKDCKHYNAGFECLIEGYGIERDEDWYCGDAERREDALREV